MKKISWFLVCVVLMLTIVAGCKNNEPQIDYYSQGYEAVEDGDYEEALDAFLMGAQEGNEQSKKAADIVSGYLNAKEAFDLRDIDNAKNYLDKLPSDYKYYAIAEDIEELKQKIKEYEKEYESKEPEKEPEKKDEEFTAQKAMEFVKKKYGVEGDLGEGLDPSYTQDGKKYYQLVADIGKEESNIKTLRIYADGRIEEI